MEVLSGLGMFVAGAIVTFWMISKKYELVPHKDEPETDEDDEEVEEEEDVMVDEDFNEELGDDYEVYFVQLPHLERPIEMYFEQPIAIGHHICHKNVIYIVDYVVHKHDGHSFFVAKPKTNGN